MIQVLDFIRFTLIIFIEVGSEVPRWIFQRLLQRHPIIRQVVTIISSFSNFNIVVVLRFINSIDHGLLEGELSIRVLLHIVVWLLDCGNFEFY